MTSGLNRSFVFLLILLVTFTSAQDHVDDFDYSDGPKGPRHWGDLKEEWKICKTGRRQSPIDIKFNDLQPICALRLLQARYNATHANLTSLSHDIALEFPADSGFLSIDGTVYMLSELHIHSPSEHTINGIRYAAEGHLVHKSSNDEIAVVSVLYEISDKDDIFIDQVEHLLPNLRGEVTSAVVDPRKLNISGQKFYRYIGSLTSPPCTQRVIWSILTKRRTLSQKQYDLMRAAIQGNNARYSQELYGRQVNYYK